MTKTSGRPRPARRITQMLLTFPTKGSLAQKERLEVVTLLSRLLLQVAGVRKENEVTDEPS